MRDAILTDGINIYNQRLLTDEELAERNNMLEEQGFDGCRWEFGAAVTIITDGRTEHRPDVDYLIPGEAACRR